MDEAQRLGVERLAGHYGEAVVDELFVFGVDRALEHPVAAVAVVVEQRVADIIHVDADLMGASRLQVALHQGGVAESLQHAVVGDGGLALRAVFKHLEAHPVVGVAADIALDGTGVVCYIAPNQRPVGALDGMFEKLSGKLQLRYLILGHHQQSGSVLVDAVHQHAHPLVGSVRPLADAQMVGEGVDQRAAEMTEAGMHHHAGGLVHNQQVIVLIDYIERNRLGMHLEAAPLVGEHYCDDIARLHLVVGLDRTVAHTHILRLQRQLNAVARSLLHLAHDVAVYAKRRLTLIDDKAVVLEQLLVTFALLKLLVQKIFGSHLFDFIGIYSEIDVHAAAHACGSARRGGLAVNHGVQAVDVVLDAVVVAHLAQIEGTLNDIGGGNAADKALHVGHVGHVVLAVEAQHQIYLALRLNLAAGGDILAVELLAQHIVGGDVGNVFELADTQTAGGEFGRRLTQRITDHRRHRNHARHGGVDGDEDAAILLDATARHGILGEYHSEREMLNEHAVGNLHPEVQVLGDVLHSPHIQGGEVGYGEFAVMACE